MRRISFIVIVLLAGACRADVTTISDAGWKGQPELAMPFGVAFDDSGAMYVIEYSAHRLVKWSGRATVLAGNGQKGFAGDGGPSTAAQFDSPHSLAVGP